MKKTMIAIATAGAVAAGGATALAASSTDAVRAVQTASKGIAHKAYDIDRDDNRWEVKFADGTERHVTLDGRRVTRTTRDDDRSTRVASARVSLATALKTAAPRANGTLEGAEIETERGRLVWSVDFADDTEVEVDARTGKVVRVNHDD